MLYIMFSIYNRREERGKEEATRRDIESRMRESPASPSPYPERFFWERRKKPFTSPSPSPTPSRWPP
jgi:hypothetical protein